MKNIAIENEDRTPEWWMQPIIQLDITNRLLQYSRAQRGEDPRGTHEGDNQ